MNEWHYTHETGSGYAVVLRTPLALVAYRMANGAVRIHVRSLGGKDGPPLPGGVPAPFKPAGYYATTTVKIGDARAVIHRAVDWLLQETGHAVVATAKGATV